MPQPDATASLPAAQPAKGLIGGGRRIRTAGPPRKTGAFLSRLLPPLQLAKPVETEVFEPRGTGGSNPSSSSGESGASLISGRNVFDDPGSGPWFGRFDLLA